jgi:hypothetical protein
VIPSVAVRSYLRSNWVRVGLALLLVGTGPLLFIIGAAAAGLWPDPNPNPVGPGLLCALTFWPALICLVVGVVRVRRGSAPP